MGETMSNWAKWETDEMIAGMRRVLEFAAAVEDDLQTVEDCLSAILADVGTSADQDVKG